jgi:hypothetical protein
MPNDLQCLSSEKSLFSRKKDERPFSILGRATLFTDWVEGFRVGEKDAQGFV